MSRALSRGTRCRRKRARARGRKMCSQRRRNTLGLWTNRETIAGRGWPGRFAQPFDASTRNSPRRRCSSCLPSPAFLLRFPGKKLAAFAELDVRLNKRRIYIFSGFKCRRRRRASKTATCTARLHSLPFASSPLAL